MRMWMCDPKILCKKHLLGEHVETHMFAGTIDLGNKMDGYVKNNLFEPLSLIDRHRELAHEMQERGMKHHSPIDQKVEHLKSKIYALPEHILHATVDRDKSLKDLVDRCEQCRRNFCEQE